MKSKIHEHKNQLKMKMSKKLVLSVALVAMGTFAMAQTGKIEQSDKAQIVQKHEEKLKKMQSELNLTDAQVTQIKALHERRMAERNKNQAERKERMDAWKQKKEQRNAEMKQILTPEQYQKWEAKKQQKIKERGAKMKEHKMKKIATE